MWSDRDLDALTDRFLASPFAANLDDDARDLVGSLLWFGTDYGPGDPMRWSPVAVEMVLADWIPRKLVAETAYLAKAPDVLRAFAQFCHHERGIRATLTDETLEAIDRWEPDYQELIRVPRLQGPEAILAAAGLIDADDFLPGSYADFVRDDLRRAVGSDDALDTLDDRPLPDEDLLLDGVAADTHERFLEVAALCDGCCDALFDVEYRTACRRLLTAVATGDPNVFRRKASTAVAAATVCWIIGKANHTFDDYGGPYVKDVMAHFGLAQGGVSQRAETMLKAAGIARDPYRQSIDLGSPRYLVSTRRRSLIERRDTYIDF